MSKSKFRSICLPVRWLVTGMLAVCVIATVQASEPLTKRKVLIDTTKATTHSDDYDVEQNQSVQTVINAPVVIRVTGYGAYSEEEKKQSGKRLLAIRASKLDAYRNLAERVYGFSVSGESTVKDFMLKSDSFATTVDTVVRGARVVSISDNPVTGIETVVELELPGDFQNCLNKVNNFKYRADCLRPMTSKGISSPSSHELRASSARPRMRSLYHLN